MKTKTHIPIVAFCARGREIGYVLMQDGRIIHYGVKTVKGKRSGREFLRRVTQALLSVLEILTPRCLVVVEDMPHRTKSGAVNKAIQQIVSDWRRNNRRYRMMNLPLRDVKRQVCEDPCVTHRVLADAMVTRYPILMGLRRDFAIYRPLYWELVCLAVALADADAVERPLG